MKLDKVSDIFEKDLKDFFSKITYVDSNPYKIKTEEVYKENDEVKNKITRVSYDLDNIVVCKDCYSLMLSEEMSLTDHILSKASENDINVGFFSKIFNTYPSKISKEINDIITQKSFVITSTDVKSILKLDCDIFVNDSLDNYIIVGEKSEILIHNNMEELEDNFIRLYYHINIDKFKVLTINY
jgi:hypothetical protein